MAETRREWYRERLGLFRCQRRFRPNSGENRPSGNFPVPDPKAAVVDEVAQGAVPELYYQPSPESVKKVDPLEGRVDKDRSDDRKRVPRKKQSAVNERKKSYQDLMLRKREQNKRAAMRYRQRKKAKAFEMFMEEKTLVNKNKRLQQKVRDIQTEIRALKVLMRVLSINKTS